MLSHFKEGERFLPSTPYCSLPDQHACAADPKLVVYDNACNLQRYALNRAPRFFKDTAFRSDRLHMFNHHG